MLEHQRFAKSLSEPKKVILRVAFPVTLILTTVAFVVYLTVGLQGVSSQLEVGERRESATIPVMALGIDGRFPSERGWGG